MNCRLSAAVGLSLGLAFNLCAGSLIAPGAKLETVSTEFELADGPAWDGSWALYIPDVKAGKLHRYNPRKNQMDVVLDDAGRISASFYNHGRLYLSDNGESRIAWLDGKKKVGIAGQDADAKPPARPNDLVVDNDGGIYYTLTRQGQVVYIAPDGSQRIAIGDIETPNGITLSPDGSTLYVASFVPKKIWAYDLKAGGRVSKGRVFSEMDSGPDKGADGMTIDRAGNVYCAGPNHIWIWDAAGKPIEKIETPTRPINCAFAGPDMQTLYITGFGGLYRILLNTYGRSPQPPSDPKFLPDNNRRPSTVLPEGVTAHLDVVYAQYGARNVLADIFVPSDRPGPHPAVVVVHGGGWLKGDKSKFRALAQELARRGYVTAAIEYRLGFEAKFPAGIHDCNAAVRFLRANAARYRLDPKRIGAVGGSAGGHLAGLMATGWDIPGLQGDGGHAEQSSRLAAAIVMAGPMEIATGSVAERSRAGKSNAHHWIGPIGKTMDLYRLADAHRHISKDDPPLLFMTGEHDKPERNQPSRDKLKAAGVRTGVKIYQDGKHGCWNQLPWFNDMVADMDAFFREEL